MMHKDTPRRPQTDLQAVVRLGTWIFVSLIVLALLSRARLSADSGLFQSELSPTPEPDTPTPTLTATVAPTVQETPTTPPEAPTATQPAVPTQPPQASATTASTSTALPSSTPFPSSTPLPTLTTFVPSPTALSSPVSGQPAQTPDEAQRYPESESDVTFDWGMLFDSVALGVSYIWLCCGVLLLLAVPLVFVVLWVASRQRGNRS